MEQEKAASQGNPMHQLASKTHQFEQQLSQTTFFLILPFCLFLETSSFNRLVTPRFWFFFFFLKKKLHEF